MSDYAKRRIGGKQEYAHRVAVASELARAGGSRRDLIVHHKNHDKKDTRPGNLKVMTRAQHNREHKAIHPATKRCAVCGDRFTPPPTHRARAQVCAKASCRSAILGRAAARRS